jgi:membrane protein required for colicin V production
MTAVDYILAAVVVVSVLFGAIRGFLRESVALLSWLIGLWVAWRYAPLLQPHLGGALADTELQVWVARALLLLAIVITGWIIASLLRGAVIAGFAVMLGQAAQLQGEGWWKGSLLMPAGEEMAGVLRGYVETSREAVEDAVEQS